MNHPVRATEVPAVHVPQPLAHVPAVQPAHVAQIVTAQGDVFTGYLMQPPEQQPAPHPAQPLPVWVRATALLMPVASGSAALGFWGLSLAAESLAALASALWHLFLCLLALAAVAAVAASRRGSGPTAKATAIATSRGLLGKTTATATATATVKK